MAEEEKVPVISVQIGNYVCKRQVEHVGGELVPGDSTYELVLTFPNGQKHLAKVSHEAFETYLEAIGANELVDAPVAIDAGSPS